MAQDLALLHRNPKNGRFGLAMDPVTKDVVSDDSEAHAVMTQLVEWRAKWWADQDGTHGSTLHDIQHVTASTQSDAEASARQALALPEGKGLITVQKVTVDVSAPGMLGRIVVRVFWSRRGSTQVQQNHVVL